ncbi:MAG: hypothetical protein WCA46_15670 [Actinocatenispora sp.]
MFDEQNVGNAMHAEASAPAPTSTVDIAEAIRVGRQRNRMRMVSGGAVAAVTTLALVGGVLTVHSLSGQDSQRGTPADNQRSTRTAAAPSAVAPRAFDPARRTFDIGWVPGDLTSTQQRITTTTQEMSYCSWGRPDRLGARTPTRSVDVVAFARNVDPDRVLPGSQVRPPDVSPTPDADGSASAHGSPDTLEPPSASSSPDADHAPSASSGAPESPSPSRSPAVPDLADGDAGPVLDNQVSHWMPGTADGEATLTWHWAPDAWILVHADGFTAGQARAVATRVARSVRGGVDRPVPMPFTMARPPAALPLTETMFGSGPDGTYDASMSFSDKASMIDPKYSFTRMLRVELESNDAETGDGRKVPYPNTKIDGQPAHVAFGADFAPGNPAMSHAGVVSLYNQSGWRPTITVYDNATAKYVDEDAAIALIKGLTVVSVDTTNPDHWATSPLH